MNKNKKENNGILNKISCLFEGSPQSLIKSPSIYTLSTKSSGIFSDIDNIKGGEIRHKYKNFPPPKTFYLFYFNILSCSISFTLIIPSLWSYLRQLQCTELYLAYSISIYALGELCGSYLASMIKNKHNTKFLLIISILIGIIGGFIYGTAGLLTFSYAPYFLLISRVLKGIWTGMEQYTEIKYISDNINLPKNSKMITNISFISSIGFIIGPGIGILLQFIQLNIGNGFIITSNMLCGYFIMTLCFIQLLMIMIFFDNKTQTKLSTRNTFTFTRTLTIQQRINNNNPDPSSNNNIVVDLTPPPSINKWLDSASPPSCGLLPCIPDTFHRTSVAEMLNIDTPSAICTPYTPFTPQSSQTPQTPQTPLNQYNENVTIGKNKHEKSIKYIRTYAKWNKFASVIMIFCFLIHFEAFSIQQTMTSYLIQRKFDWKADFANYLYILCGIMWMTSFYFINKLLLLPHRNRIGLVKISLFMGVISTFCLIFITFPNIKYLNKYLYLFGFILISFTFPFGRASVISLYSICTNYKYLEWIYLISMISRIITPFIGILYFTNKGPTWTYGNITVLFMIAVILCSFTSSLKKKKIPKNPDASNILFHHGYSVINIPQIFYTDSLFF